MDQWMDDRLRQLAEAHPELDRSKIARFVLGEAAEQLNRPVGVIQGVGETAKGLFDAASFGVRLLNPFDPYMHEDGDAAWDHVADAVGGAADYLGRAHDDPSILKRDAITALRNFRESIDPTATPMADTLAGEYDRRSAIGRAQGKTALDAASMVEGGLAVKGLGRIGAARTLTAADYAAAGFKPRQIARMMEPYDGLGHHSVARRYTKGLPQIVQDNPFFVVKPSNMTRGEFYQLHFGVDPKFNTANLPRARGGPKSWSGEALGQKKYGPINRYAFGTPEPLQVAGAANGFGPIFRNYLPSFGGEPDDQNHSRVQNQYSR